MKNKTVFAFLAGFATCAAALYGAGNHTPAIYFAAGTLAASVAFAALGRLFPGRTHKRRSVNRPNQRRQVTVDVAPTADARRKCEAGTFKKPSAPAPTPIESDVISALKNFGASDKEARELAALAVASAGAAATFEQVMSLALRQRRKS